MKQLVLVSLMLVACGAGESVPTDFDSGEVNLCDSPPCVITPNHPSFNESDGATDDSSDANDLKDVETDSACHKHHHDCKGGSCNDNHHNVN